MIVTMRQMQAVGTMTGGPPYVQRFVADEALVPGDVVTLIPSGHAATDGRVQQADGTVLTAAELIDISALTIAGEGFVVGVCLSTATAAGDVVSVACAGPGMIFEANLTNSTDGATLTNHTSTLEDKGEPCAIIYQVASGFDGYALTITEGTEGLARIVDLGYGIDEGGAATDVAIGDGIIGDANVRAKFTFDLTGTLYSHNTA